MVSVDISVSASDCDYFTSSKLWRCASGTVRSLVRGFAFRLCATEITIYTYSLACAVHPFGCSQRAKQRCEPRCLGIFFCDCRHPTRVHVVMSDSFLLCIGPHRAQRNGLLLLVDDRGVEEEEIQKCHNVIPTDRILLSELLHPLLYRHRRRRRCYSIIPTMNRTEQKK